MRRRLSATAHQPADRAHQLVGELLGCSFTTTLDDAVASVLVEQPQRDLVERGLDGADLRDDVDAVTILLDHLLDPAHLSLDAAEAVEELVLRGGVPARIGWHGHSLHYPPGVYRGRSVESHPEPLSVWMSSIPRGPRFQPPAIRWSSTSSTR